jgi:hypothetical protein
VDTLTHFCRRQQSGQVERGLFISPVPIGGFIQDFILISFLARRTQWSLRGKEFVSLVDGKNIAHGRPDFPPPATSLDLPQRGSKAERLSDAYAHTKSLCK